MADTTEAPEVGSEDWLIARMSDLCSEALQYGFHVIVAYSLADVLKRHETYGFEYGGGLTIALGLAERTAMRIRHECRELVRSDD